MTGQRVTTITGARRALCGVGLAALALGHAMPSFAQGTPAPEQSAGPVSDQDIIVTARRREESLQNVPVAVTAIGGATLAKYAVSDVQQISQLVPSMVVGRQASGSSASIFLRGVGSTSLSSGFDQSVSLNMDDLPMSRGKELLTGQYDLARVEVLKGPQALFFGKNSTAGVVILTSANPTDKFEAMIRAGYEFQAQEMYGEGYISGPIAPYLNARLAFRASTSEGPYYNTAQTNSLGGAERIVSSDRRGESRSLSGRLTVQYDNPDVLKATLKASISRVDDDSASALYERLCAGGRTTPRPTNGTIGAIPEPFTDCAINGRSGFAAMPAQYAANFPYARDGRPYTDYDAYTVALTLEKTLGPVTLTSITGQYGFRQQDLQTAAGSTAGVYFTQYNKFRQFSEELRASTDFDGAFNLTAGAFYGKTKYTFNTAAMTSALIPAVPSFFRVNGIDGESISVFAELKWNILENLELAGGARWSDEKKTSFAQNLDVGSAAFPARRFDDYFHDTNLSPQATLTWKATDDITLYCEYKKVFKSGGYNTCITILASSVGTDGRFKSETAEGGEIGLRTQLFERQLRFNVTAYHYRYSDLQVQVFDAQTIASRVANAGSLTTDGVEVEANFRPRGSGFETHASIAYNEAKFHNYIGSCFTGQTIAEGCNLTPGATGAFNNQNFDSRIAPKAPKWAGRVGASYETPLSGGIGIGFNGDMSFSSSYNFTDTLRPDGVQKAFARFDAGIRLFHENDGWEFAVIGRNLTNRYVVTTANDMPAQGASGTGTATGIRSDMNGIVDRPRSVFVQFTKKF
ncbi:MAG: TonB-dependent receptor [Sphingobium sp.]